MSPLTLNAGDLELVAVDGRLAALAMDHQALAHAVDARPSPDWPPEFWDEFATILPGWVADLPRLGEGWGVWLIVRRDENGARTLIGNAGFKGPPSAEGRVDVGYSVCASHQGRGHASAAVEALCRWAAVHDAVRLIVGETLDDRPASMRVLERCGFTFVGHHAGHDGEERVRRYERRVR